MRRAGTADRKRTTLREQLWPGSSALIWDVSDKDKVKGFATVSRLMPWVLQLIRDLANREKGGDPCLTYLELWCRDFGQGIISITDEQESAYAAGYTGNRALRTWRSHMMKLVDLGFIRAQADGNRDFGHVLLLNPLAVCHGLYVAGKTPDGWWAAFNSRANQIGAEMPPVFDDASPRQKPNASR